MNKEQQKEEQKEYNRKYYKKNIVEHKKYMRKYYKKNKVLIKQYSKEWNEKNKDKMKAYAKKYNKQYKKTMKYGQWTEEQKNRFILGLKKYNLTFDEIIKSRFRYIGGSYPKRLKYFKLCCPNKPQPIFKTHCICGHAIKENCYISNFERTQIIILGNCCIKRFILLNKSRLCNICDKEHKNRSVNKCNDCRFDYCERCNEKTEKKYCLKCDVILNFNEINARVKFDNDFKRTINNLEKHQRTDYFLEQGTAVI